MLVASLGSIWDRDLEKLLDTRCVLRAVDSLEPAERDAVLAEADVLISPRFTAKMGKVCRRLRLLVCPPAGTEGIDRAALPAGVVVVNGSGHEIAMAEHVIGSCIALRPRFLESDSALRHGRWRYGFQSGNGMLEELWGSTCGLVGFGGIGREIAGRAATFGMRCAAVTLHPEQPHEGFASLTFVGGLLQAADVDRLVAWSDQLILCCELSPLSRGLIDARRLSLMQPSSVLVNVARGPIVVERDLYEALKERRIAGAALDVWYQYPHSPGEECFPSTSPFWELENVIMTPHASGWTKSAKRRRLEAMAKTINEFAAGSK